MAPTARVRDQLKTLAVTRPVGQGEDTARFIRGLGWTPLIIHTVELRPREKSEIFADLSKLLSEGPVDWLVLMSPNGVSLLFDVLKSHGNLIPSALGQIQLLAVGPKTRDSLSKYRVRDVHLPESFSSVGVADFLSKHQLEGKRVILTRSSAATNSLAHELEKRGALVDTLHLYGSVPPSDITSLLRFVDGLRKGEIHAVLFTSSVSAFNLFAMSKNEIVHAELVRLLGAILVGAIGPVTAQKLRQLGVEPKVSETSLIEEALKELVCEHETAGHQRELA